MKPGIAKRLRQQARDQQTGNRKLNEPQVRKFKQLRKDGASIRDAADATNIKHSTASNISSGLTWSWVILFVMIAFVTMGNQGCERKKFSNNCKALNYPLCAEVPNDYPCLCLNPPQGVTPATAQAMRHLNDN